MQGKLQDGSIIISGILGNDPEYKQVGEKKSSLTKFSVKVGERPTAKADEKPEAIWAYCQCWHELARAAAQLKKGDSVLCIGRMETREYNGKEYKSLNCDFVTKSLSTVSPKNENKQDQPQELLEDYEELLTDDGCPF